MENAELISRHNLTYRSSLRCKALFLLHFKLLGQFYKCQMAIHHVFLLPQNKANTIVTICSASILKVSPSLFV